MVARDKVSGDRNTKGTCLEGSTICVSGYNALTLIQDSGSLPLETRNERKSLNISSFIKNNFPVSYPPTGKSFQSTSIGVICKFTIPNKEFVEVALTLFHVLDFKCYATIQSTTLNRCIISHRFCITLAICANSGRINSLHYQVIFYRRSSVLRQF